MPKITTKELFAWSSYLGNLVGDNFPVLQETACMTLEYRRLWAYLHILEKASTDKEIKQEIAFIKSCLQILGQAEWQKDTITDMALRLGTKSKLKSAIQDKDSVEIKIAKDWFKNLELDSE